MLQHPIYIKKRYHIYKKEDTMSYGQICALKRKDVLHHTSKSMSVLRACITELFLSETQAAGSFSEGRLLA